MDFPSRFLCRIDLHPTPSALRQSCPWNRDSKDKIDEGQKESGEDRFGTKTSRGNPSKQDKRFFCIRGESSLPVAYIRGDVNGQETLTLYA